VLVSLAIIGFAIWFFLAHPLTRETNAVGEFKHGVERLEEQSGKIFHGKVEITFDIKKTDSVLEPMVGILKIVKNTPSEVASIHDLRSQPSHSG